MSSGNTLSCFTEKNLYAKKEFYFSDTVIFVGMFIAPLIMAFLILQIHLTIITILKKNKSGLAVLKLFISIVLGFFIADLFTAICHCVWIDDSYRYNVDKIIDGHLVVETKLGYASCHHIFPSNWKDVKDSTIIVTGLLMFAIPIMLLHFIPNNSLKLVICSLILFLLICPFTHKYAHEKLHGRHVPWILDVFFRCGLFLDHKKHQKHHIENNYNWSLLSGVSDNVFDFVVHSICNYLLKCPKEDRVYNAQLYKQHFKNTDIIKIKFVGDIEGRLDCRLKDNLFIDLGEP
jgi:hypothetical protein